MRSLFSLYIFLLYSIKIKIRLSVFILLCIIWMTSKNSFLDTELSKLIFNYKELHYSFIYFGTNKLKCEWVSNIGHAPQCIWEYFCTQLSRYLLRLSVKTSLIRLCRILIKQSANTIENLWLIKNFKGRGKSKLRFFGAFHMSKYLNAP